MNYQVEETLDTNYKIILEKIQRKNKLKEGFGWVRIGLNSGRVMKKLLHYYNVKYKNKISMTGAPE